MTEFSFRSAHMYHRHTSLDTVKLEGHSYVILSVWMAREEQLSGLRGDFSPAKLVWWISKSLNSWGFSCVISKVLFCAYLVYDLSSCPEMANNTENSLEQKMAISRNVDQFLFLFSTAGRTQQQRMRVNQWIFRREPRYSDQRLMLGVTFTCDLVTHIVIPGVFDPRVTCNFAL